VTDSELEAAPRSARQWRRPLTAAAVLALVGCTALAAKKAATPCQPAALDKDALVGLFDKNMEEMSRYGANNKEAVKDWVKMTSKASESVPSTEESERKLKELLSKDMDADETKKMVDEMEIRSLQSMHKKREALKEYLQQNSRNLKSGSHHPPGHPTPATTAECVFNIEQALAQMAALGANIADTAKTCYDGVAWKETPGQVCAVNLGGVFYSVSTIAGSLSMAAENCGKTVFPPDYKALCAAGATGLSADISQLASSAALTAAACKPDKFDNVPVGAVPANFGVMGTPGADVRRLSESNATAEARRLVYGGGQASMTTQCVVDAVSASWWLAQAAIAINAAVDPKEGASCKNPKFLKKGSYHTYTELVCAVDVIGAVHGFFQVIEYILLAVTHCTDTMHLPAMCGAGIQGLISSITGSGESGIAVWLNCYKAQGWKLKRTKVREIATQAAMNTRVNGLRQEGNFGRRLEEVEADIEELKKQYGTPEEAWKSLGFDFSDPDAAFRDLPEAKIPAEDLVSLMETPTDATGPSSMFDMCS